MSRPLSWHDLNSTVVTTEVNKELSNIVDINNLNSTVVTTEGEKIIADNTSCSDI